MPSNLKQFVEKLFQTNKENPNEILPPSNRMSENHNSFPLSEGEFQNFIKHLSIMFYTAEITPPYDPVYISPASEYLGYSIEEWRGNQNFWEQIIHEEDREEILKLTQEYIKEGKDFEYEYRIVGKNNEIYWVKDKGCLTRNQAGEVVRLQGAMIDFTKQKETELEIKRRENLYRTISRNIPNTGTVLFDHDLRFTLADGELLEKMDLTPRMMEGKTVFEVFPTERAEQLARYFKVALAGGFISIEREIKELDMIVHNYFIPLKNEKKEIYGGMSIWQDITDSKRRNERLRESEERYYELFEGANDLVYVHDLEGNYLSMNRAAEKVFGFTREEILKLSMAQIIAPEFVPLAKKMMAEKLKKGAKQTVYEIECIAKDGHKVILEINSSVVFKNDKPVAIQGIARDITERKQTQEALVEREERLRNLFENANDLIYLLDLDGKFISGNKVIETLFGYSLEELQTMHFTEIVAPEFVEFSLQLMVEKLNGVKRTVYEIVCITKTGKRRTLEVNSSPMYKNGKLFAIQGIARDITERKIAEKRIQDSETEFRALFSAMTDLVLVFDRNGQYLKIPPTDPSLLVRPASELIGKTLHDVFPPTEADHFLTKINQALDENKPTTLDYSLELKGKKKWFSSIVSPMPDETVLVVARDITDRKLSEEALRESEEKYRELFENANDLIYTIDMQGNFTSLSRAGERISGYKRKEAIRGNINISQIVAPEFLEKAKKKITEKVTNNKSTQYELEIIAKDGHRVPLELNTRIIYRDGKPVGIQGIGRDISERKKSEAALKASESQYRFLSEGIMHQVWTALPDGKLDYVNGRTLEYFNKKSEDLINESWMNVVHPEDLPECLERWINSLKTGELYETEFRLLRNDGTYRWHRALATPGLDANGKIVKWYGTNTDIHDQKIAEEKLSYYAKHDSLTNLPNRVKFMNHLERIIKRTELQPEVRFAVLFLDLDRFKLINDSLGHLIGDKLLVAFAERLETCVRPGDVVARLGGDEFTILLNNLNDQNDAIHITNRLIHKLSEPFYLDDYEVFTSASLGIVISDEIIRDPEDFLRDADTAMYRAKEAGKARYEIFNKEMHIRNKTLLQIENDLRRAIEREEFRVLYQPIISLETGEICEFEALIRWYHPEHGLVEPMEFIRVAEETGLIIPIGNWIIKEASRQTADWQRRFPNSKPFIISINLSSKQLMHPPLATQIKEVLAETELDPRTLRLEVTESVVMENAEIALNVLNELSKIGVSLSTDDFGTGYSSLSYLHRFPFDSLKIDRTFISRIDSDKKSGEIVRTILMLAQNLNLEAIAEGIETEEQLRQLQFLGCRFGQGYLFSRPIPAPEIEQILLEKSNGFRFTVPPGFPQNIPEAFEVQ